MSSGYTYLNKGALFGYEDHKGNPIEPISGAMFLYDKHRYKLWRTWAPDQPMLYCIGLNPSNAGKYSDDPTIRRIVRFASRDGFGGIVMLNLFSNVQTTLQGGIDSKINRKVLQEHADELRASGHAALLCFGAHPELYHYNTQRQLALKPAVQHVFELFPNAKCLGHTKHGLPIHPLYVPQHAPMIDFIYPPIIKEQ